MDICIIENCSEHHAPYSRTCKTHTCSITMCYKKVKKNSFCKIHLCDLCKICKKTNIDKRGCFNCVCKIRFCNRKSIANGLCISHICRFCNLQIMRGRTCRRCACSFGSSNICKSIPKYATNKDNPYIKSLLSTNIPCDVIISIIIPYMGIMNDMCDYHMKNP